MKMRVFLLYILGMLFNPCIGLASNLNPARSNNLENLASKPIILTELKSDYLCAGVRLFTNRDYLAEEIPREFNGLPFLRSSIETVSITCLTPGIVYVLSPTPRPNSASQEKNLLAAGFRKLDIPEFQLFPGEINKVSCYEREVAANEHISLSKWVILVFEKGATFKQQAQQEEILYNGIALPSDWLRSTGSMGFSAGQMVPYLEAPPKIIPINVGRQLFVDNFLIESTSLKRRFHAPEKFVGNPILQPDNTIEQQNGFSAAAAPFSDGVFYDPVSGEIKMWYQAGWFDGTALAISRDAIHWTRPSLTVIPNTNLVLPSDVNLRRDASTIWLDSESANPEERYKMLIYQRPGSIGGTVVSGGATIYTSANGSEWVSRRRVNSYGDNDTFYYNPFRKKWVFALKAMTAKGRMRYYWECSNFIEDDKWGGHEPVPWLACDALDTPDPLIGDQPQLYKFDAVAYESVMVGLFQILYGPDNSIAASKGIPKTTDLQVGFSRDGFHWDRPNRKAFIPSSRKPGIWDRGYVTAATGGFIVLRDSLVFFYTGFKGDEKNRRGEQWSGMYSNSSTGIAVLRRDGFASMEAEDRIETLTTRLLVFDGSWLFVNLRAPQGELKVEILDQNFRRIGDYSLINCIPVSGDSTKQLVLWKNGATLASLSGKPVRFRFHLKHGALYSFWVSESLSGESRGYLAAGAVGIPSIRDIKQK